MSRPPQNLDSLIRNFAYENLTKEHASADSVANTADQSARELARELIGPSDASEAKELEIAGILIDLLTYLTNLSDDMKQKNVPDDGGARARGGATAATPGAIRRLAGPDSRRARAL